VIYIEFFPHSLFVSNSQVKTASEMTYTVSGGALNSTQSNSIGSTLIENNSRQIAQTWQTNQKYYTK